MGISSLRNRLPPLGTLAAFEAACRHRSFTRAAAELNLTQAAVSRQIRALEQHLGAQLFERRRHDVALTPEGVRFAAEINPALATIGDATVALKSGYTEELTVMSELCLAAHWLMPRLSRFQADHTNLSLRILTSSRPIDAQIEKFDVALTYGFSESTAFHSEALAPETILAVCSPVVRAALPKRCSAGQLAAGNLIHFEQRGSDWMDWRKFLARFKVKQSRPARLIFNTYNNAIDAAIEGHGTVLGWRHAVDKPLSDGRLVAIDGLAAASPDPLCAHTPASRSGAAAVQTFIAWLRRELQDGRKR